MESRYCSIFRLLCSVTLLVFLTVSVSLADCEDEFGVLNENDDCVIVPDEYVDNGAETYPLIVLLPGWFSDHSGVLSILPLNDFVNSQTQKFFLIVTTSSRCPYFAWQQCSTDAVTRRIDWMKERYPVDENRVYVAGHSAGGSATYKFALDEPGAVPAILVSAGSIEAANAENEVPEVPTAVLAIQGTEDGWFDEPEVEATANVQTFADAAHCQVGPLYFPISDYNSDFVPTAPEGSTTSLKFWAGCDDDLYMDLLIINGGGHDNKRFQDGFWEAILTELFSYSL